MRFCDVWIEQCEAAKQIEDEFGTQKALDYYVARKESMIFAIPAGWGDFAIGITAPIVACYWRRPYPSKIFYRLESAGEPRLGGGGDPGVLASRSPVGILAGDVSTRLMGQFPLSVIPTFVVPQLLILHLISLSRVRKGMT